MISLRRNLVLLILFALITFISREAKGDHHHHSEEILALVGSTAILNYTIGDVKSEFTITWTVNGSAKLQQKSNKHFEKKEGKFKSVITNNKSVAELHIANVDFEDAGKYDCSVVFYSAGTSLSYSWMLTVQGRPRIDMSPFLVDEPTTCECCVQFAFTMERSGMDITWKMNFETLQTQTFPGKEGIPPFTMETLCSNITLNLHRQHNGHTLQCLILNSLNASVYVTLNVKYLEHVDVIVGSLYNPSDVVKVAKNENINITCLCYGCKIPNILLQKRNMESIWINAAMKAYPVKQNATITSQTFLYKTTDYGRFRCKAYNNIGLSAESKEFQIEEDDSLYYQGPNTIQTIIVVCVGFVVVMTLIVTKRTKGTVNPILTTLRYRSSDDRPISQGVPDICRNATNGADIDDLAQQNTLESEEHEKTEKTSNEGQGTDEIVSTDVAEHIPKYADVQKTK